MSRAEYSAPDIHSNTPNRSHFFGNLSAYGRTSARIDKQLICFRSYGSERMIVWFGHGLRLCDLATQSRWIGKFDKRDFGTSRRQYHQSREKKQRNSAGRDRKIRSFSLIARMMISKRRCGQTDKSFLYRFTDHRLFGLENMTKSSEQIAYCSRLRWIMLFWNESCILLYILIP